MRSHAIPMRLLKQFASEDSKTKSLRMWRYERGVKPNGKASPKSETRTDGYFARPSNPSFEEGIEKTLADQIENEVHSQLDFLGSRIFVFSDRNKRSLTKYIALLFMRCPGRKEGVKAHIEETRRRLALLFENEEALLRYTMKVSIKERVPVSVEAFRRAWNKLLATPATAESLQEQFAASLERWTTYFDDHLYHGQWSVLHSEPGDPFVLGDNPVVTWRLDPTGPSFGVGLHQPGAEVFLPVSPTACLRILPSGHPRHVVSRPTAQQINEVQAMFMTRRVYSRTLLPYVDELVQRKGGTLKIGYNCFLPTRNDEADLARMLSTV